MVWMEKNVRKMIWKEKSFTFVSDKRVSASEIRGDQILEWLESQLGFWTVVLKTTELESDMKEILGGS